MDTPWGRILCSAMDCGHFTMKQKRKKPVARTPEAVAKYKELFLEQLALARIIHDPTSFFISARCTRAIYLS
jgi:hypothetical protein